MKTFTATLILSLLMFSIPGKGQDIHFSKFFAAPLILNPANTTNYHGNWNVISNYRSQGVEIGDAYITSTITFDMPVYIKNQRAGIGLIWINDKTSDNTLVNNGIYLSSAYFVKISKQSYLHMGLQAGYVLKYIDYSNITFPDQFDMSIGYFNSNLPTEQLTENARLSYLDLNWGLIWSYKIPEFTVETGVSMFHYNMPTETFVDNGNRLQPRYVGHAFVEKVLFNNFFIKPKVLYVLQNKASEFLTGFDVGVLFPENKFSKNFYAGIFLRDGIKRNSDAVIIKTGFNYKSFDFALSYDIEVPGNEYYTYTKNAFELSVSFKRPETNIKNKIIPSTVF